MSINSLPKFVARRNVIRRKDGKVFAYIGGAIPEDILQRTKVVRVYLLVGSEKIYAGDHKVNKYRKNVFVFLNADVIEVFSKDSPEVTLLLEPLIQ